MTPELRRLRDMKGTLLVGLGLVITFQTISGQHVCLPAVLWQTNYGSCGIEQLRKAKPLPDGGYIFAGYADWYQACLPGVGNKTSTNIASGDIWLVRTDATGNMLWDGIYGTTNYEFLADLVLTPDGGFLVGAADFRVFRIDAAGNHLWTRDYGGSGYDELVAIQPTPTGGFILAGSSDSPPGGNKTSPHYGFTDFWLVLLDANAQKLWDKSFGDRAYDQLLALCVTRDGGFAFAGTSSYYPEPTSHSSIFRLDPNGNLLWKRPLPQFYSISSLRETTDGDLILGATSQDPETFHFALLRFDAGGHLLWQKTYGGVGGGADLLTTLDITPDSGFILGGSSYSGTGGDKTGLQYGEYDWWLVRVDSHGNKLWDVTFGGPTEDHLESIQATTEGSFILAGSTDDWSDLRSTFGADDFWVIKLGPEDCDGDGVPDSFDLCPGTPPGAIVNAHGCSVEQLCPCNGPWHTHGEYTQSVKESARAFLNAGLITESQMRALVKHAANSSCGK